MYVRLYIVQLHMHLDNVLLKLFQNLYTASRSSRPFGAIHSALRCLTEAVSPSNPRGSKVQALHLPTGYNFFIHQATQYKTLRVMYLPSRSYFTIKTL